MSYKFLNIQKLPNEIKSKYINILILTSKFHSKKKYISKLIQKLKKKKKCKFLWKYFIWRANQRCKLYNR